MAKSNSDLLPLPIAAAQAGVSYGVAWRAVVSGDVIAERRGGRVFVSLDALRRLTRANEGKRASR